MSEERKGPGLGLFLAFLGIGFGTTIAYLIGTRLSNDAVMIIVGIGMGLLVIGLPCFVLMGVVIRRSGTPRGYEPPPPPYVAEQAQPQVVVLQQPGLPAPPPVFERSLAPTGQPMALPGGSGGGNGRGGGIMREL